MNLPQLEGIHLSYKCVGSGFPILLLHGMYSNKYDWGPIYNRLSKQFQVIIPDLRNHGDSPHAPEHTYENLVADVWLLADRLALQKFHLIGHSMGGKLAMKYALTHPQAVEKLVVVDVSPVDYYARNETGDAPLALNHQELLEALLSLDLSITPTMADADHQLSDKIPEQLLRKYLLKNFRPQTLSSGAYWKVNFEALHANLKHLMGGFDTEHRQCLSPTLFMKGQYSPYLERDDLPRILGLFPKAQWIEIAAAGHVIHLDQKEEFLKQLLLFLG